MVSHPPSHSGVRQALALPLIDAERHGEYGHNICLPSVAGHPATSSAPTRRSQRQLGLKERALEVPGFLAGSLTCFVPMSGALDRITTGVGRCWIWNLTGHSARNKWPVESWRWGGKEGGEMEMDAERPEPS